MTRRIGYKSIPMSGNIFVSFLVSMIEEEEIEKSKDTECEIE